MATIESKRGPRPANLIQSERSNAAFDIDKMHQFLEGSAKDAQNTLSLMQQIERDPYLKVDFSYYESCKSKIRELTAQKIAHLATYMENDFPDFDTFTKRLNLIAVTDPGLGTRIGVHYGLFLGAIKGNGTDEQFKYWAFERNAILMKDIYGCFAMTEMAHGSNVAGLETTATFDKENQRFIINTPHVGATKWWIGGAAHSATHTVVYARLIVEGKDYGIKTFVVPLRDSNHDLYPGVAIGDIGAKMGRDGIDNGWIQFSSVTIPKSYMLQKYAKVDSDGDVTEPPLAQIAYGALLGGRVTMVEDSFRTGERFITIALRYAVGRRQFADKKSKEGQEMQIIDYPLHQYRLLPYLAYVYAMSVTCYDLRTEFHSTLEDLDKATRTEDLKQLGDAINRLKSVFQSSASLKSTGTWMTANLIDECRQSCGGHGYSAYSGFGKAYNDWVVQCTWEGDNNILASNAGRIIVQTLQRLVSKQKKAKGEMSFINKTSLLKSGLILNKDNLNRLDALQEAYEACMLRLASFCSEVEKKSGSDSTAPERIVLSKLHAFHYMISHMRKKLESADGGLVSWVHKLCELLALYQIEKFSGEFLQFEVVDSVALNSTKVRVRELCLELRKQVIPLTDSFKFSDFFVNSPLGCYNGDIYANYYSTVKAANDVSANIKAPYSDAFEAMLGRDTLEARERFQKSDEVLKKLGSDKNY